MSNIDGSFSRTYSSTMVHVEKTAELSKKLNLNHSEIIRLAIDRLYETEIGQDNQDNQAA